MILKQILKRRSIRDYKVKPVPEEDILDLLRAAYFAPSALNNKSIEFIVIKDQKIKEQLYSSIGKGFIDKAPLLIIPVIDIQKTICPVQDLSVASENIFLQAEALGLGSVWKNIPEDKRDQVKKILGMPKNFLAINLIPVGFAKTKKEPHDINDFDSKRIHLGKW